MKKIIYNQTIPGLAISRVVRDYEFTMPIRHMHDEYEIYYLIDGERYYFIENQIYHVKKGSLVLINRNQIHKTVQFGDSSHERIAVMLGGNFLSDFLAVTGELSLPAFFRQNQGVFCLNPPDQEYVLSLLNGIAAEMNTQGTGYRAMILTKLTRLLIFCQRYRRHRDTDISGSLSASVTHQKVSEVASYISSHFAEASSLDTVARHFFMSKSYLSRIFKQATGYTVNEYINVSRVQEAERLLIESDLSVTLIAEAVGYESITYFEKIFRSHTGTSPLKYRKQHRIPDV
ncbi:AraC family transcriptional regulator [Lachnoclostridium sp. An169]|uniref:AraC family transcriptional regulator n=1 Tax=Lachnoclostridium sp. An169 TaxID=1965569 RepID=UPI000B39BB34|nr:AraC family transcriptional regulator [Lachnoclostridium sp. An169]OUP83629.1 AraC family transcriptional regulator [Lachnoclostridium sp. An169]